MIPIPDIRERNDHSKDKRSKYQFTSNVQYQMVQKFVKELNDSAKQPDRSDSAEHTATEQAETTAREIVHEAMRLSHSTGQYPVHDETTDSPSRADALRERVNNLRAKPESPPQHTPAPAPQAQMQQAFVKKQRQYAQTQSIESIYPPEAAAPILQQSPVSDVPTIKPERRSVTAGSEIAGRSGGKSH